MLKHLRSKSKAIVALVLVITIATTLVVLPIVNAHDPPWTIPTWIYITVNPDPVGVGQTVSVVFWINWIPQTASGKAGDRWYYLLDITKPDETKQTQGPLKSDPVGSSFIRYTPDQVGTYTFTVRFGPQVLTGSNGTGIYNYNIYINDTFQANSATTTLTVQQEPVPDPLTYPLPTEYWARPIEGQNTDWWKIASNWLGSPQIVGEFQPDGTAPNSPHIMWTKPIQFGGVVGGSNTFIDGATFYDGTAYQGKFTKPIIMYGKLFYPVPQSDMTVGMYRYTGSAGGYACIDLRTGEEIYWKNMTMPSFGQLYYYDSMNQHGVIPNGYLWTVPSRFDPPDTPWKAYDPMTGEWLFSLTNVPSGTTVYGPNGEILIYRMNYAARWLALWNNTCEQQGLHGGLGTGSGAYSWRPVGKTVNMSNAYSWNVTIPELAGLGSPTIVEVIPDDLILGRSTSFSGITGWGTPDPWTMWAISLKPASRGQLLWIKNYTAPAGDRTLSQGLVDPETRVFTMWYRDSLQWAGYSIDDGSLLWGPTPSEHPWSFYAHTNVIAYGKLYSSGYGIVYCYDLTNGKQIWNYSQPGDLNVPYPNYPLSVTTVADGKVYMGIIEHSAGAPYWKGAKLHCVNATTGEKIWDLASHTASTAGGLGAVTTGYAVADGYYVYLNLYDMQIYCIGKGPSATTVTASPKVSVHGSSVLIEGTVIDTAAGTKQHEQAARFPNGVPAISDADIGAWMEYLYMQKPIPTGATGVEVTLDAVDPNGNWIHIGRATTDMSGMFSHMFTPEVPGKYMVIATFEGSDSYYASYAETAIGVSEAPPELVTPATEPQVQEDISQAINSLTPMFLGIIVAVVVAIVLAVYDIIDRKRK